MDSYGQRIKAIEAGQSAVLEKVEHGGSLEARRMSGGAVLLYWRHTEDKRTERRPIGPYDSAAPPKSLEPTPRGYSVRAALMEARRLAERNANTPGGLRAQEERDKARETARARAEVAKQKHTLKALCSDYVGFLRAADKPSWRDAENIFANHLEAAFPELVLRPAAAVEKREVVVALRRLIEARKATTARKLRAYLKAAFACALRADSDAAVPSSFIAYNVTSNPVDGTAAIKGQADKNPLPPSALRRYWKALQGAEGAVGAALRLHVVSGGQRAVQLARLTDADAVGDVLRLLDPKGKRDEPREHLLPITKPIRAELAKLPKKGFVLSTDGGVTPMHATSLSAWASELGAVAKIDGFQLKRVRSGIETLLAEAGVSREIRGQLQSHGIGGVQERHYDAHQYLPEKRQALDTLYRLIGEQPATSSRATSRKRA